MENASTPGNDLPADNLLGISIEGETRSKLETITTWSKITAIGGFLNMGLNLVSTIITFQVLSAQMGATLFIAIQVVSLVISFFLNFCLWQFGKSLKTSLSGENQEEFVQAAAQLKAYMRMLGILLIASIVLGMVSGGLIAGSGRI